MDCNNPNRLRPRSGLLPKGVLELGLEDDGDAAWCRFRADDDTSLSIIEVPTDDAEGALARELMCEHRFGPLLAIEAVRQLFAEHRRRNTRH